MEQALDVADAIIEAAQSMTHLVGDGTSDMDDIPFAEMLAREAAHHYGEISRRAPGIDMQSEGAKEVDALAARTTGLLHLFGWINAAIVDHAEELHPAEAFIAVDDALRQIRKETEALTQRQHPEAQTDGGDDA